MFQVKKKIVRYGKDIQKTSRGYLSSENLCASTDWKTHANKVNQQLDRWRLKETGKR